jgi:hypothetical protein
MKPHTFTDYFQMSRVHARDCCLEFDKAICQLYVGEYMRAPTANDLKNISKLHKIKHGVPGMFGSLDCMHTHWKNCPKAWQGNFKGKEKLCTLVLEGACDYNLWFWHAFYGCAGSFNDLNVLALSCLLKVFLDGSFQGLEEAAGVIPFDIKGDVFREMFLLVDGIYPKYSRFVKPLHDPVTDQESSFSAWQEGAQKDIERAFGLLQGQFQFMAAPIHMMILNDIAMRVKTCLILHNIGVADRVMEGDINATYNPANNITNDENLTIRAPRDLPDPPEGKTIVAELGGTWNGRWNLLSSKEEHSRLHKALLSRFY